MFISFLSNDRRSILLFFSAFYKKALPPTNYAFADNGVYPVKLGLIDRQIGLLVQPN